MIQVANHLWQSTIFALAAAIVAWTLRHNSAAVRYRVWLTASLKFLLPFSLLIALGSHTRLPRPLKPEFKSAVHHISRPLVPVSNISYISSGHSTPPHSFMQPILLTIWILGCGAMLVRWFLHWRSIRVMIKTAKPLSLETPIPAMTTQSALEPGVFGIWKPVLLLPDGITAHLTPEHLAAIVAHELCHVRRRDNLAAAAHMLIQALFWFHPMVWWIGARLVDERERACDDEVLRLGSQPPIYAESILKVCQFYLESPLACVSGVTGADLKQRLTRIMTRRLSLRLSLLQKAILAAAAASALALPLSIGLTQVAGSGQRPAFDIISIKPSPFSSAIGTPFVNDFRIWLGPDNHMILSNVTLAFLIKYAYRIHDDQISGLSVWSRSKRWDIEAKCDPPIGGDPRTMSFEKRQAYEGQAMLRLQSLLADKFHLTLRQESKQANVLALLVNKNGPKFIESPAAGPDGQVKRGAIVRPGNVEVYRANMDTLARMLSEFAGRIVVNRTGLEGTYDLKLDWSPESYNSSENQTGPSLFNALKDQLGLKLEAIKAPIPLYIVQEARLPDPN